MQAYVAMRSQATRSNVARTYMRIDITQRVNTPLTAENEGQISRVSAHWVLDMLCGDI